MAGIVRRHGLGLKMRFTGRLRALRIAARRGKQIAVVALARRLAGILYALLRDGTVYEPRPAAHHPGPVGALPA